MKSSSSAVNGSSSTEQEANSSLEPREGTPLISGSGRSIQTNSFSSDKKKDM